MRSFALCLTAALLGMGGARAEHAYSLWGDIKYPVGFSHFAYVNPDAPKGGEVIAVSNLRVSTFDKYNPFTVRGTAPAYLDTLLFESLLTGAMDEPGTAYGQLAEDVSVAKDGLSATFRINAAARFHNGKPVEAADVKHSVEMLRSKFAKPQYATLLDDVASVDVLDALTVRFTFKKKARVALSVICSAHLDEKLLFLCFIPHTPDESKKTSYHEILRRRFFNVSNEYKIPSPLHFFSPPPNPNQATHFKIQIFKLNHPK